MKRKILLTVVSALVITSSFVTFGCVSSEINSKKAKTIEPAKQEEPIANIKYGYISGNDVILREGPSTNTKVLDVMNRGYKTEILEEIKTGQEHPWYKVKTEKNNTGYVYGKFISQKKLTSAKNTAQASNGISIPKGYKLVKSGSDYIVIQCSEESSMGGPKYCYDKEAIDYCAKTINNCIGAKTIIGGYDGEIITIFNNGTVSVKTAIGSKTIQRFYKKSSADVMKYSLGNLVAFKIEGDNGGWRKHENGMQVICGCGNKHQLSTGKDSVGWFVATAREGLKDILKNKWK